MKITQEHLDIIREIVNIGAGHASNALSSMVGHEIMIEVPEVARTCITEVESMLPEKEGLIIYFNITEGPQAHGVFYLPENYAIELAEILTTQMVEKEEFLHEIFSRNPSSMIYSAVSELGNILAGAFVNALSEITGQKIITSIPFTTFDHISSVFDGILAEECAETEDVIVLKTIISSYRREAIQMEFILLPTDKWIQALPLGE